MKKFYVGIILIVVIGLVLAYFLFPSKKEEALILLKDHQYLQAEKFFLDEYNKGNHSQDILIPLEVATLEQGNISFALKLMQEYILSHPNDIESLKQLALLYHVNQNDDLYYATLLKVVDLGDRDPEILESLATWYQQQGKQEPFCEILAKLIQTQKAKLNDYRELALCYAQENRIKEALSIMEAKRKKFPKETITSDLLFEIYLEHTKGDDIKEKIQLLAQFILEKKDPQLAYYALGILKNDYPSIENYYISLIDPLVVESPLLQTATLEIEWEEDKSSQEKMKTMQKLLKLYTTRKLNTKLQNLLFNVLLDRKEDQLLLKLIKTTFADQIDEQSMANLAFETLSRKKSFLAEAMMKALGPEYLQENPFTHVILLLAIDDEKAKDGLEDLLKETFVTQEELLILLRLSSMLKWDSITLQIGSRLPPFVGMNEYDFVQIASVYTDMKKAQEIYKILPKITASKPALKVLEVSMGKSKEVADWLHLEKNVKEYLLSALYDAAEVNKEYLLALYVAKRQVHDYPSLTSRAFYANALVQIGKVQKGLELLGEVYHEDPTDPFIERAYFDALVLVENKELLQKFMQTIEARGKLTKEYLLDFAYTYLDVLGDFKKAAHLFWIASENASPKSDEVQTLIYLWGPKPSCNEIAWVEKRALSANHDDLGLWLQHLISLRRYHFVIDLFEKRRPATKAAVFAYLNALSYYSEQFDELKPKLKRAIAMAICYAHSEKDLKELAAYAEEAENFQLEADIWKKLRAPSKLAKAEFAMKNYSATLCALRSTPKNLEPLYEYGTIWESRRCFCASRMAFLKAIHSRDSREKLDVRALVLFDLDKDRVDACGKYKQALYTMHQYYERASCDSESLAAYANLLMDADEVEAAKNILH